MKRKIFAALYLTSALATQPVLAEEFIISAPITKVQAYRDGGATVFRTGTVTLPVGRHTVVIPKVTDEIEDDVTITFRGAGVYLRNVETEDVITSTENNERKKALIEERDKIDLEINKINAQRNSKSLQQKFLETLASPSGTQNTTPMKVQDWSQALAFVGEQSASLNAEVLELDINLKRLHTQKAALDRQIKNVGYSGTDYQKIVISIEAAQEQQVEINANYFTDAVQWSMDVRGALNTDDKSLELTQTANISQETGIDWEGINLVLSNTRPSGEFGNVSQQSTILRLREKLELQRLRKASEPAPVVNYEDSSGLEEIVVTAVTIDTATFDKRYILPGKVTIQSTGEEEHVELAKSTHATDLVVRALPSRRQTAYAFADTTLENFDPVRSITAELWRDENMIGSGQWPDLETNTPLQLPFGIDEAINIEYIEQAPQDGENGFFKKHNVIEKHFLIKVTNNHATPMPVEIFDKVPVSGHEDIEVKTLKAATEPAEKNIDGKQGLLKWRKTMAPGETWEIKHQYRITFPNDKLLQYR